MRSCFARNSRGPTDCADASTRRVASSPRSSRRSAPRRPRRACATTSKRGRTFASPAHRDEDLTSDARDAARAHDRSAFEIARDARLDALAIDALHMMVAVDPAPRDQLAWNLRAIAYMEQSTQPDAKRWEGSLRNNVGHAHHLLGEYDAAIDQYRLSLAAHERAGRVANARIAHWMIAKTMRAQARYAEAIAVQLRLEREWDAAGEPDPSVYEELEQLYAAIGDRARADTYAVKLRATRDAR